MSEVHSSFDPTSSSNPAPPAPPGRTPAEQKRFAALLGLLLLMLVALWYDYQVARPAVADAYDRIALLNEKTNSTSGRNYMTEKDVQAELKRAPSTTFSENRYFVEVYSWRAGLPIKTHDYYAVYTSGPPHIFLMHYKNELDRDELNYKPPVQANGVPKDVPDDQDIPTSSAGEPGPAQRKSRRPQSDRPAEESTPDNASPGTPSEAAPSDKSTGSETKP